MLIYCILISSNNEKHTCRWNFVYFYQDENEVNGNWAVAYLNLGCTHHREWWKESQQGEDYSIIIYLILLLLIRLNSGAHYDYL